VSLSNYNYLLQGKLEQLDAKLKEMQSRIEENAKVNKVRFDFNHIQML